MFVDVSRKKRREGDMDASSEVRSSKTSREVVNVRSPFGQGWILPVAEIFQKAGTAVDHGDRIELGQSGRRHLLPFSK